MIQFRATYRDAATEVRVGGGTLDFIGQSLCHLLAPTRVLLVTDSVAGPLHAGLVERSLSDAGYSVARHTIPAGEPSKSLAEAKNLYNALSTARIGRDGIIVAVGGGVVSDLAGFAAATWLRGIDFAICPTTVESCVDACLGGKTAVNIEAGKNLVGVFHHPNLIVADPRCLTTLSPRDVRAGLAESIKHGLVFDERFLTWHEEHVKAILQGDSGQMEELVAGNLRIKADVVTEDDREKGGRRILLNFGHTIGHAIEKGANYALRHGECVALGMLAAVRLSHEMGLCDAALPARTERVLRAYELPTSLDIDIPEDQLLAAMQQDKKVLEGRIRFVLLEDVGKPVIRDDVKAEHVARIFRGMVNG